jgi:CheY-like chemotaxis protein
MANVLIVDDEPLCREFVTRTLQHLGHHVTSAADGETAIDFLRRSQVTDLLIVDIRLKGLDGLAVVRALEETQPNSSVILTTGYVLPADVPSLFRRDNVWYLPKPFRLHSLTKMVREALASVELRGAQPATGPYSVITTLPGDQASAAEPIPTSTVAPVPEFVRLKSALEDASQTAVPNRETAGLRLLLAALVTYAELPVPASVMHLPEDARQNLVRDLISAIVNSCSTVEVCLVCAWGLRTIIRVPVGSIRITCRQLARRLEEALTSERRIDPRVATVLAEILARGRDSGQLREGQLATDLGVDPAHLGHLLRKHTGFGFMEWIWGVKLFLALPALARSDQPIKTIAYECGFANPAQFSKSFRRIFGLAPSAFRGSFADAHNRQSLPTLGKRSRLPI